MKSAWSAAAFITIAACGGAVFAQSATEAENDSSPFGVLASLEMARVDEAGVGALKFPMSLPAPPEAASVLESAMFNPRPMWPAPVGAQKTAPAPDTIAEKEAEIGAVQIGAVITARY